MVKHSLVTRFISCGSWQNVQRNETVGRICNAIDSSDEFQNMFGDNDLHSKGLHYAMIKNFTQYNETAQRIQKHIFMNVNIW
jgi:hypothetical protein